MDKRIKLCYCDITTSTDLTLSATQLRSYIGYKFVQEAEFHHHDGKPYRYPLIQYKRIRDRLSVLGMERFADVVQENLSNLQKIYLKNTEILINNMIFTRKTHSITEEITEYKFATPWIALNTDNYLKYNTLDKRFHKKLLEKILTGNLLSMMRGIDCTVDYDLYVKINQFKQLPIIAHKHSFSGFYASFVTNLSLPQYIGIGKSVSKGFGMLERKIDN